jgi:hypothetical protein
MKLTAALRDFTILGSPKDWLTFGAIVTYHWLTKILFIKINNLFLGFQLLRFVFLCQLRAQ